MSSRGKSRAKLLLFAAVPMLAALNAAAFQDGEEVAPPRLRLEDWAAPPAAGVPAAAPSAPAAPTTPDEVIVPWSAAAYQSYEVDNWEIYYTTSQQSYDFKRVTNHPAADIHPSVNRGATRIAFASDRDGDFEIYTANPDGTGLVQVTFNDRDDVYPAWSPDGTRIAFQAYRDGQAEIYTMAADGSQPARLTADPDYDATPTWSPDGSRLAFVSRRTGGYRIYTMNADGTGLTQVSNQPYSLDPAWSPDGTRIAFDSDPDADGWLDMWVMNADGSDQHQIYSPDGTRDAVVGSWSPDSQRIAYALIDYVQVQGNWYWQSATLYAWRLADNSYTDLIYPGYYRKMEPDWQTTDAIPPESHVLPLPALSPLAGFNVMWTGDSLGQSPLYGYDIQRRIGQNRTWTDWLVGTGDDWAPYPGTAGATVYFRSRARDQAGNLEAWPPTADAQTTFYHWSLFGQVTDNRGVPLVGKPLALTPAPLAPLVSDEEGTFLGHTLAAGSHSLSAPTSAYGELPTTTLSAANGMGRRLYLPPADNAIENGTFETGAPQPAGWLLSGTLTRETTGQLFTTGARALSLGRRCVLLPCLTEGQIEDVAVEAYSTSAGAVDDQGNLHVVYLAYTPQQGIYYSWRSTAGVWSAPVPLGQSPPTNTGLRPSAAFDSAGNLHAAWIDGDGLKYARRTSEGTWLSPQVIAYTGGEPGYRRPELAVGPDDTVHLLYWISSLFYMSKSPGGTWLGPEQIWNEYPNTPNMVVGPDGSVHVAWQVTYSGDPAGEYLLFYRRRSPDGVWTVRETLYPAYTHIGTNVVDLLIDPVGTLHLIIYKPFDPQGAYHGSKPAGGQWTALQLLPDMGLADAAVYAAVDGEGVVHIINENSNNPPTTYYRQYKPGEGWAAPEVMAPGRIPLFMAIGENDLLQIMTLDWPYDRYYQASIGAAEAGNAAAEQTQSVPADAQAATLSFMARASGDRPGDATRLEVTVTQGVTATTVFSGTLPSSWAPYWADVSAWAGQEVTVRFDLQQATGDPAVRLLLDDVSLGSAHPDLWVTLSGPASAAPGQQVTFGLAYANRGAVDAAGTVLTLDLPGGLEFVSATVEPVSTAPLTWDLGELPAGSAPASIQVTVAVSAASVPPLNLPLEAAIAGTLAELETLNNTAAASLFVGYTAYLPVIDRP